MTNTYQKILELVSRSMLQERMQLRSKLDDMMFGDIRPTDCVDQLLEEGEKSIQSNGTEPLGNTSWAKLKAPYAN